MHEKIKALNNVKKMKNLLLKRSMVYFRTGGRGNWTSDMGDSGHISYIKNFVNKAEFKLL